jgi:chromosome segregation ATPase
MNQDKGPLTNPTADNETTEPLGLPESGALNTETEPLIHELNPPNLQAENQTLKSEVEILRARLESLEAEKAKLIEELEAVKYKTQDLELLDETKTLIVTAIGKLNSCQMDRLKMELSFMLASRKKQQIDVTTIRHHLDILEEQGYIEIYISQFTENRYSLTPKGRKYYVDKNLAP